MKKKYVLLLMLAFLILSSSLILFSTTIKNNTPWYTHLEYSPPLTSILELDTVTMNYCKTEITHIGNVIIATVVNNSNYWIIQQGFGSFYHDALTTKLEFYDGYDWRLVPTIHITPPPPSMLQSPIPAGESLVKRFNVEYYFGVLKPGLYRIRMQYAIYSGTNLYDITTAETRDQLLALSQRLGAHELVAEFHWSGDEN